MSYGWMPTGLGTPVGGATSYGSTSYSPSSSLGSTWNFGSTLNANLWATGVGHIATGVGEVYQSGLLGTGYTPSTGSSTGSLGNYGYTPLSTPGTLPDGGYKGLNADLTAPGTGTATSLPDGGYKGLNADLALPQATPNAGLPNGGYQGLNFDPNLMAQYGYKPLSLDPVAPGTANGGGLNIAMTQLNDLLKGYNQQAPQNNVANLVNRATQDPRLTAPVTQIANDPQGNKLLNGALDAGLQGIQVTPLAPGLYGQYLPDTRQIQIGDVNVGGNDLIRTLAHELVHAATPGNGNSLNEEGYADRLGTEIQRRLTGLAPGYVLGGNSYNGLPQDNGIASALRLLGIAI